MQQRSQEARQNWEAALDSKDRALAQLEDALVTQKRSLQQQMEQQQAAVSMTHSQLLQGTDAQLIMQRQLDQSQQQVAHSPHKPPIASHDCTNSPNSTKALRQPRPVLKSCLMASCLLYFLFSTNFCRALSQTLT